LPSSAGQAIDDSFGCVTHNRITHYQAPTTSSVVTTVEMNA
jgi:hypothetical protein